MRSSSSVLLSVALLGVACTPPRHSSSTPARTPSRASRSARAAARDTVVVKDSEQEKRAARLELRLMEKEAQVEDLQARLEDARAEVVRAMSTLRTVASRAEAASGMAEAEVALQSLRSSGAAQSLDAAQMAQVSRLMRQSAAEFDRQNYGGALYLANQTKALASSYRGTVVTVSRTGSRPGETPFALPLRLLVANRGNVREGPGTGFAVAFAAESGMILTALSYTDEWVRVSDDGGRSGWIFRTLVTRP